ncbi:MULTISPECIES: indolepyruvate ferredoxin oxidoreductase subunit alpha [Paenibacillus]|jgi:NAD-dependent dihydropyrimidine dehydrogenase PreA subunit|uniref:Ferredoxin n=1 Tax=Paenibacillus oceani TaxID=2772510 RepID=A0A927CAB2_9BACL|nr:4Fe-4S binding protein [Paenibacillus oceani]MBD2862912.1 4Fe-4S binding protein [Paenibacillus oceani]
MTFVITSACIGEKAEDCVDVCPVDCIRDGGDQYYIDPDICISCGACEVNCPVSAIYYIDDVPEEEEAYIQKAVDFFKKGN